METPASTDRIDILALVSGPEPQRTLFENILLQALEKMSGTRVLIRGIPGQFVGARRDAPQPRSIKNSQLNLFDHLPGEELTRLIAAADQVVCRSGYTTVMELAGMGKRNVLFIPTPGQPEQEYLARHLQSLGLGAYQEQEEVDLEAGFQNAKALPGFPILFQNSGFTESSEDLADWIREHPLFHPLKRLQGKFVL